MIGALKLSMGCFPIFFVLGVPVVFVSWVGKSLFTILYLPKCVCV